MCLIKKNNLYILNSFQNIKNLIVLSLENETWDENDIVIEVLYNNSIICVFTKDLIDL